MNDLIDYLLNFAFDHGIGFKLIPADPYAPSVSLPNTKLMIINTKWHNEKELPFIIGHEIGHLMLGDHGIMYYRSFSGQQSNERPADLYALKLIYDYSSKLGDAFDEPFKFMQAYGIPERMRQATEDIFKNNNDLTF